MHSGTTKLISTQLPGYEVLETFDIVNWSAGLEARLSHHLNSIYEVSIEQTTRRIYFIGFMHKSSPILKYERNELPRGGDWNGKHAWLWSTDVIQTDKHHENNYFEFASSNDMKLEYPEMNS